MRALALALALTSAPVLADAPRPAVDWAAGRLTATGFGVADRQAPSPATARGPSRRAAEIAARARLRDAIATLPVATGGDVAAASKDPAVAARLTAVIERAREVSAELETDGSWQVALAVPLEAVHQALTGIAVREPTADDNAPAVVVLETSAPPALGYRIAGQPAALLWVGKVPAWAKGAPRVRAKAAAGELTLARALGGPSTLYVVVR